MDSLSASIAALPPPVCPEGFGAHCPGPFDTIDPSTGGTIDPKTGQPIARRFERVSGAARLGEIDVTVRCLSCQARAHYTLDAATAKVIEKPALTSRKSKVESPKSDPDASAGQPAGQAVETVGHGDEEPEHDAGGV